MRPNKVNKQSIDNNINQYREYKYREKAAH